jgi:hypothetical protein
METDWRTRYLELNNRHAAEYRRRREEEFQRDLIAQEKRRNDLLERQSHRHHGGGILVVALLGLLALVIWVIVVGLAWLLGFRRARQRTEHSEAEEQDLINLLRQNKIDPGIVSHAIEETLRQYMRR